MLLQLRLGRFLGFGRVRDLLYWLHPSDQFLVSFYLLVIGGEPGSIEIRLLDVESICELLIFTVDPFALFFAPCAIQAEVSCG